MQVTISLIINESLSYLLDKSIHHLNFKCKKTVKNVQPCLLMTFSVSQKSEI